MESMEDLAELEKKAMEQELQRRQQGRMQLPAVPQYDLPDAYYDAYDAGDLRTMALEALPELVNKAIMLALESDKLREVHSVMEALADRVHGRPQQSMDLTGTVVPSSVNIMVNVIDSDTPQS